jgi:hypothetical protein
LTPLKELQDLNLTDTKVTKTGIKDLEKALPKLLGAMRPLKPPPGP